MFRFAKITSNGLTYKLKVGRALESTFGFFVNLIIKISQPSVNVGKVCTNLLPIAIEDCIIDHVKTDRRCKESVSRILTRVIEMILNLLSSINSSDAGEVV